MEIMKGIKVCPFLWMNFDFEESGGKKTFIPKPKHQNCVSWWKEHVYLPNHKKKYRLSRESKFVTFNGWPLILRKIMEVKAVLTNPKHQNRSSQWQECIYCA